MITHGKIEVQDKCYDIVYKRAACTALPIRDGGIKY